MNHVERSTLGGYWRASYWRKHGWINLRRGTLVMAVMHTRHYPESYLTEFMSDLRPEPEDNDAD